MSSTPLVDRLITKPTLDYQTIQHMARGSNSFYVLLQWLQQQQQQKRKKKKNCLSLPHLNQEAERKLWSEARISTLLFNTEQIPHHLRLPLPSPPSPPLPRLLETCQESGIDRGKCQAVLMLYSVMAI